MYTFLVYYTLHASSFGKGKRDKYNNKFLLLSSPFWRNAHIYTQTSGTGGHKSRTQVCQSLPLHDFLSSFSSVSPQTETELFLSIRKLVWKGSSCKWKSKKWGGGEDRPGTLSHIWFVFCFNCYDPGCYFLHLLALLKSMTRCPPIEEHSILTADVLSMVASVSTEPYTRRRRHRRSCCSTKLFFFLP